jgi:hypothetical protein
LQPRPAPWRAHAAGHAPRPDPAAPAAAAGWLSKQACEAKEGYNRWLQVPCAVAVSGACGSNYAWSAFNAPLSRELGVVAAAGGDWPLTAVIPMFSVATVGLGLGAHLGLHPSIALSKQLLSVAASESVWKSGK